METFSDFYYYFIISASIVFHCIIVWMKALELHISLNRVKESVLKNYLSYKLQFILYFFTFIWIIKF